MSENKRYPNLFWPVILVGAGVILLLSNLGLMDFEISNLLNIFQLWPLLLVAIGINLLFGGRRNVVSSVFSLLLGLIVIGAVVFAPTLIAPVSPLETDTYTDLLGDAESARVRLDFDRSSLEVFALADSDNLIEVEVLHSGKLDFTSSGDSNRNINLKLETGSIFGPFDFLVEQQYQSEVGLSAELPIELIVDIGSGNAYLDLEELNITDLEVDSGSGKIELVHPAGAAKTNLGAGSGVIDVETVAGTELDLKAEAGSGRIELRLADEVTGYVKVQSGSGRITIYIPRGLPVRIKGTTGSGNISVPNDYLRVSGSNQIAGDSGTWESPEYDNSDEQLRIEFSLGSGSFQLIYE